MIRQPLVIRLETENYIVRTVERSDANERWAGWLLDPVAARQLNAPPRAMTLDELKAYIVGFDRVNTHLIGIFEKDGGRIVGIRSIQVNFPTKAFLDNVLIGEVDARGKRARAESTDALWHYFSEVLGFENLMGTVLADNQHMLDLVARKGFVRVRSDMKPSAVGGRPVEVRLFRLTRDARRRYLTNLAAQTKSA